MVRLVLHHPRGRWWRMFRGTSVETMLDQIKRAGLHRKRRVLDQLFASQADHVTIATMTPSDAYARADAIYEVHAMQATGAEIYLRSGGDRGAPLVVRFPGEILKGTLKPEDLSWSQTSTTFYGRTYQTPRLVQWYTKDESFTYGWRGHQVLLPLPVRGKLRLIQDHVEALVGQSYDGCLANLYRDGRDHVGWHADDEPILTGEILSVSFGATRDFILRKREDHGYKIKIPLRHGDVLWMHPDIQTSWQHCVPKRRGVDSWRINLTFRCKEVLRV